MTRRLDWEKAARRDQARERKPKPHLRLGQSPKRQEALEAFVQKHGLACFSCGTTQAEWAKSGINKRGPWVICASCITPVRDARR